MDPEAIHIASPQQAPEEKTGIINKLPRPKKPSPLMIILALIAVFALGTSIYFANQIKNLKETYQSPQFRTSTGQVNDPTANWKTYTNSEYGFSVQYPPDYSITEEKEPLSNLKFQLKLFETKYENEEFNYPYIYINVIKTPDSEKQWITNNYEDCTSFKGKGICVGYNYIKDTTVNNLRAVQFDSSTASTGTFHTLIKHGQYLFNISNRITGVGTIPDETYNQILSTFKFLD